MLPAAEPPRAAGTRLRRVLANLWDRLFGGSRRKTAAERESMTPAERSFADESIEDMSADELASEHLGGFDPGRLIDEGGKPRPQDDPPRD
jgi:hypothetical protein